MSGFMPSRVKVDALIFDKDGTLFDFHSTWGVWAHGVIMALTGGVPARMTALAEVMKYDLDARAFHPSSTLISDTNRECAETMAPALPDYTVEEIEDLMTRHSVTAPLVSVVPLPDYLARLAGLGLRLGVMTNDSEASAHAQLHAVGAVEHFDFIAGYDSGHGAKPAPDPLLAFARTVNIAPARIAMVGDSLHDLIAGRAAGMLTIGVLTGPASAEDLAPLADVVLPDIGHIPGWLEV